MIHIVRNQQVMLDSSLDKLYLQMVVPGGQ